MNDLPVDFEAKVKLPGSGGGTGYPYQISAGDLMDNFDHCNYRANYDDLEVSLCINNSPETIIILAKSPFGMSE
jgi:hypothetical protein